MKNISNGQGNVLYAKLTKAERFKSKSLLIQVLKNGYKIHTTFFRVNFLFKTSSNHHSHTKTILGISIPKKVTKKAVERNRMKRLLKHAWQSIKNEVETQISQRFTLYIFITAYQKFLKSMQDLREELTLAIQKILLNLPHAEN